MFHASHCRAALALAAAATLGLGLQIGQAQLTLVAGTDAGVPGQFRSFDAAGNPLATLMPYGAGFTGGVRVAVGDLTGDGHPDIVTGVGPGGPGGHVKVFDGATNAQIRSFFAFDGFSGGVRVAAGDVTGDGVPDIVTGADAGPPGGHVKVFDGVTNAQVRSFFAFDGFTGGVRVATGDIDGDGHAEIITGAGIDGAGGHVKVFDGLTGTMVQSFLAYNGAPIDGAEVGGGDLDGDGLADIVTGAGSGGSGGHVKVFSGLSAGTQLQSFFAFAGFSGGVRVATGDVNGDGLPDIAAALDGPVVAQIRLFAPNGTLISDFYPFGPSYTGGLFIEAAPVPEPTAAALVGLASLFLTSRRRVVQFSKPKVA